MTSHFTFCTLIVSIQHSFLVPQCIAWKNHSGKSWTTKLFFAFGVGIHSIHSDRLFCDCE